MFEFVSGLVIGSLVTFIYLVGKGVKQLKKEGRIK